MIVNAREEFRKNGITRVGRWLNDDPHSRVVIGLTIVFGYWFLGTVPAFLAKTWPYLSGFGVLFVLIAVIEMYWRWRGWDRPAWVRFFVGPTHEERQATRQAKVAPEVIEIENLTGERMITKVEWWPGTTLKPRVSVRRTEPVDLGEIGG